MRVEVIQALEEITNGNGGKLTPDLVIEHARNPESPLHTEFNWDVEQAAMSHWRSQARRLISSVLVSIKTSKSVVNCVAYVRDPDADYNEQGYVPTASLVSDEQRSASAMLYEISRLNATLIRAEHLAEALLVEKEIKHVRKGVDRLRARVEQRLPQAVA